MAASIELPDLKSLHARAERNVGSSPRCCDGSVSGDPAISGTKEISGDGRRRRGRLFRTAQRWVSQYRKFGLIALTRKSRDDRGARRVVSPKIKAAIEGLALERPPLPIRSICRQIRQFAEATGERLPRYGTVYDLVREVPGSLLTLAHRGSKAYSEGFDLVHRRDPCLRQII